MDVSLIFISIIIIISVINLARIVFLLIGSDLYYLKRDLGRKDIKRNEYKPVVSIIIPAYNEQKTILATLKSVLANSYPKDLLDIIVVDDGSQDTTSSIVADYIKENNIANARLITQANEGKANALNNAIKNYAIGELIMCLDADSILDKHAIKNCIKYFTDPRVYVLGANVKTYNEHNLLALIQKFEYIIGHKSRRAHSYYGIEYVVGGVGSTFRKEILEIVNFYPTYSITEDMALTFSIVTLGKKYKIIHAYDVLAYTQGVLSIKDLVKQRYRWRYGRFQTLIRNRNIFFNGHKKYKKLLTFVYLPFTVFTEILMLFEPLVFGYIIYVLITMANPSALLTGVIIVNVYLLATIMSEEILPLRERFKLLIVAPTMYFYFYILNIIEFIAILKALLNLRNYGSSIKSSSWEPVSRETINV